MAARIFPSGGFLLDAGISVYISAPTFLIIFPYFLLTMRQYLIGAIISGL
jgi:hypothetical protein